MKGLKRLGYIDGESLIHFASEETTPKLQDDEIVIFNSFFQAGFQLPIHQMVGEVLNKYEVFMHQLMPNAIMRLGVFLYAMRSQGAKTDAKCFYYCMSYIIRKN